MCSGWNLDGVKYQEININKITLVNVARVIPPALIAKFFREGYCQIQKQKPALWAGSLE